MFFSRREIIGILLKNIIGYNFFSRIYSKIFIVFSENHQIDDLIDTYFHKLKYSLFEAYRVNETSLFSSSTGIDYSHLKNLLRSYNFSDADEETKRIILEISNGSYLWAETIPCEDLSILNDLWDKYSHEGIFDRITGGFGRYGFGFVNSSALKKRCIKCNISF